MLTTPMTEASRRIVRTLSMLANRSPAVMTPTMHRAAAARRRGRGCGPTEPAIRPPRRAAVGRLGGGALDRAVSVEVVRSLVDRAPGVGLRALLAHAAFPSMTRSRTRCSSISSAGASCDDARPRGPRGRGRPDRAPPRSRWTRPRRRRRVGQRADEGVDLGAGADVDAAGRLVEEQHPAVAQQPAGEHDLLLVAARQGAHRAGRPRPGGRRALASARRRGARSARAVEEAGRARSGRALDTVMLR